MSSGLICAQKIYYESAQLFFSSTSLFFANHVNYHFRDETLKDEMVNRHKIPDVQ